MQSAPCRVLFQPARATIQTANPTVPVSVAYSASTFVACRLSMSPSEQAQANSLRSKTVASASAIGQFR